MVLLVKYIGQYIFVYNSTISCVRAENHLTNLLPVTSDVKEGDTFTGRK